MSDRRTGRTTRTLEEAVVAARAGKRVAVVFHDGRFIKNYGEPLLASLLEDASLKTLIDLVTTDDVERGWLRGRGYDVVLEDHACREGVRA